jgi:hypothetical protein
MRSLAWTSVAEDGQVTSTDPSGRSSRLSTVLAWLRLNSTSQPPGAGIPSTIACSRPVTRNSTHPPDVASRMCAPGLAIASSVAGLITLGDQRLTAHGIDIETAARIAATRDGRPTDAARSVRMGCPRT